METQFDISAEFDAAGPSTRGRRFIKPLGVGLAEFRRPEFLVSF